VFAFISALTFHFDRGPAAKFLRKNIENIHAVIEGFQGPSRPLDPVLDRRTCLRTEKATIPISLDDLNAIKTVLGDPASPFKVIEVDDQIAFRVALVPGIFNADPGDRIIVATAEVLGLPLMSSDSKTPHMTPLTVIW
jgi:hypothetical protein